ncbi:unnamed protein product [marine sediment metagenome]|uniref:Uncharacterized protein n=1 Tax=marine sediment metagenome TaxID=412755 RepID=X1G9W3_9ZZZZ
MDSTEFIHFFDKPTIAVCKKCKHFCGYRDGVRCFNCGSRDYYVFESEEYEA